MANSFESEISRSLNINGWFGRKQEIACTPRLRFTRKGPFDFLAVRYGQAYAFEAKQVRHRVTSFPFSNVDPHQVDELCRIHDSGACAYVLVCFRKPKIHAYAIEIVDWTSIQTELYETQERVSIPREMFDSDPRIIELPRQRTKTDAAPLVWYDFDALLDNEPEIAAAI